MKLKNLIGSGDKIMFATAPIVLLCLFLNSRYPAFFNFEIEGNFYKLISIIIFTAGVFLWLWSVYLIVTKATKGKLITGGPYSIVKHPIYTFVGLLVIPFGGLLINSWLGIIFGLVLYLFSRKFVLEEEKQLSKTFGDSWNKYTQKVKIPWL